MTITICLGSACHVKGSHFVLEGLKALIKEYNLEDQVTLAGTFCTGNCQRGVCVTIGDQLYSVSPDTTRSFFESEVLAKL
ncbi:MAG: (2Fe-2S) ferredoxin domain-containing protein [Candidatus Spyradocola sp.]|nr:(2Fe-2S) ferredoxin domain-containing protein [Candidatus Spyradocola sp.]